MRWKPPARPRRGPAGSRSICSPKTADGAVARRRALLSEIAFARRIRLRPRLGRGLRARGRRVLPEAPGLGAVHAGDRPAAAGAARRPTPTRCAHGLIAGLIELCRHARGLLGPLSPSCRKPECRRCSASTASCSAPISSSTGRMPATPPSTRSWRRSRRASARPSGASGATRSRTASRVHWLTGTDLTESGWDAFFEFYMETGSRKWGRPYLTRQFYSLIGETHGRQDPAGDGQARRPLHRRRDQLHRLATRCTAATGARSSTTRSCISSSATTRPSSSPSHHKLKRVEAGAQGEHKLARGYLPVTTHSAHYIADPGAAPRDRGLSRARARLCGGGRRGACRRWRRSARIWPNRNRIEGRRARCRATTRNNIFAKILRGELPCHKVYEDDKALAFLDIMPRAPGHTLVLPKAPARNLLDVKPDDLAARHAGGAEDRQAPP